jgi:hypothetical protein
MATPMHEPTKVLSISLPLATPISPMPMALEKNLRSGDVAVDSWAGVVKVGQVGGEWMGGSPSGSVGIVRCWDEQERALPRHAIDGKVGVGKKNVVGESRLAHEDALHDTGGIVAGKPGRGGHERWRR